MTGRPKPRTVLIVCRRMPRNVPNVPAIRQPFDVRDRLAGEWRCSWCGQRVKVVT